MASFIAPPPLKSIDQRIPVVICDVIFAFTIPSLGSIADFCKMHTGNIRERPITLGVFLGVSTKNRTISFQDNLSANAVFKTEGSIPAASTINTPSNIQRRPKDGVFFFVVDR